MNTEIQFKEDRVLLKNQQPTCYSKYSIPSCSHGFKNLELYRVFQRVTLQFTYKLKGPMESCVSLNYMHKIMMLFKILLNVKLQLKHKIFNVKVIQAMYNTCNRKTVIIQQLLKGKLINLDSVSKISRKHDQKSPKSPTADIKIHFTTRIVSLIQILSEIMATMNKLIG